MEYVRDAPETLRDRTFALVTSVAFVVMMVTMIVTMVFSDASMRHFVVECTGDGGHVEVVQRQLVCLGGKL